MGSPRKKRTTQMPAATFFRCGKSFSDQLSTIPVIRDSTLQNSVSIPRTYRLKCLKINVFSAKLTPAVKKTTHQEHAEENDCPEE